MARRGYARVQSAESTRRRGDEAAGPLAAQYTRVGGLRRGKLEVVVGQFDADPGVGLSEGGHAWQP